MALALHCLGLTYLTLDYREPGRASGGDNSGVDKPAAMCGEGLRVQGEGLWEHVFALPTV